jgi:hypothetical protein
LYDAVAAFFKKINRIFPRPGPDAALSGMAGPKTGESLLTGA